MTIAGEYCMTADIDAAARHVRLINRVADRLLHLSISHLLQLSPDLSQGPHTDHRGGTWQSTRLYLFLQSSADRPVRR